MGTKKKPAARAPEGPRILVQAESTARAGRTVDLATKVARADAALGVPNNAAIVAQQSMPAPSPGRDVLRQNVSLPPEDRARMDALVERVNRHIYGVSLSAIVRAGLIVLDRMKDEELAALFRGLPRVPAGRKPRGA